MCGSVCICVCRHVCTYVHMQALLFYLHKGTQSRESCLDPGSFSHRIKEKKAIEEKKMTKSKPKLRHLSGLTVILMQPGLHEYNIIYRLYMCLVMEEDRLYEQLQVWAAFGHPSQV